ncbi:MAG: hypothetical protein QW695_00170 [Candidatus Bathyarchaeia archaeon]
MVDGFIEASDFNILHRLVGVDIRIVSTLILLFSIAAEHTPSQYSGLSERLSVCNGYYRFSKHLCYLHTPIAKLKVFLDTCKFCEI